MPLLFWQPGTWPSYICTLCSVCVCAMLAPNHSLACPCPTLNWWWWWSGGGQSIRRMRIAVIGGKCWKACDISHLQHGRRILNIEKDYFYAHCFDVCMCHTITMSVCSAHSLPYRRLTIPGHTITISLLLWPCQTPNLPVKTPLGISELRLCTLGSLRWQLENGGTLYYIVKIQDFVFRTRNDIFVIWFWLWVLFFLFCFDSLSKT